MMFNVSKKGLQVACQGEIHRKRSRDETIDGATVEVRRAHDDSVPAKVFASVFVYVDGCKGTHVVIHDR